MRSAVPTFASLAVFAALCVPATDAAADDADDDELPAGLIAHVTAPGGLSVTRIEPRVSLSGRWSSLDRRLPDNDDQLRATYSGLLKSQSVGDYRLLVYGRGSVKIRLRGQVVLDEQVAEPGWRITEPIALPFDFHPFQLEYQATAEGTLLSLFWIGPGFGLEPVPPRQFAHVAQAELDRDDFGRGESLVRALRCTACHAIGGEPTLPAPALDRLAGFLHRDWLVKQLTGEPPGKLSSSGTPTRGAPVAGSPTSGLPRRMPHFGLPSEDATAIAAFLLADENAPPPLKFDDPPPPAPPAATKPARPGEQKPRRTGPDAHAGQRLAWTLGCIACHTLDDDHSAQPFDGGDLRRIALKRPSAFFERWLAEPTSLNADRRMPEYELNRDEREDLAAYLATLGAASDAPARPAAKRTTDAALVARGRQVFVERGCVACHRAPGLAAQPAGRAPRLSAESPWEGRCLDRPDPHRRRPGYELTADQARAVRAFVLATVSATPARTRTPSTRQLLAERGCVACHPRDSTAGIAGRLPAAAARFDDLAPLVPAMTPPSLTSIGDKLFEPALAGAITRLSGVRRPYLLVRMPKFRLTPAELDTLIAGLTAADHIPDGAPLPAGSTIRPPPATHDDLPVSLVRTAGGRLVTPDGFGCTSCHAVGKVEPPPGPIAARGPNLSQLGTRIRRTWFDRFVPNPVRIVPRMEMPSVQLAVRGVLDDRLDRQLDAVWRVLNLNDFEPPEPNPIQTLRRSGVADDRESAAIVTDLVQGDGRLWIKPLLVGLPNRHNLLLDLESARLVRWSIGDVARQRAKGKGWHWEAAGANLLPAAPAKSDLALVVDGQRFEPRGDGQFATEPDEWRHRPDGGMEVDFRLNYGSAERPMVVRCRQVVRPLAADHESDAGFTGWGRNLLVQDVPPGAQIRLEVLPADHAASGRWASDRRSWTSRAGDVRLAVESPSLEFAADGSVLLAVPGQAPRNRQIELSYRTSQVLDRFIAPATAPAPARSPETLHVAPGFQAVRLALPPDQMPTALAWRPNGQLLVASLKGRVWTARDTDGDQLEDELHPLSDELAAPYGLAAQDSTVDVTTKFGVVRLHDDNGDGWAERSEVIASGWGHTADYHDWTIGLPRDGAGGYYIGLACQQDKRTPAAAAMRGSVVQLVPRSPTPAEPRRFELRVLSGGHRFPMGLARNQDGALFVTDNQGNYNPFNELNHVRTGLRFGFINANEVRPDFKPPVEEPAINIPHPWTRSVNGIEFLETPAELRRKLGRDRFGPWEGHLVGCEYDTRRLVRMSLQRVGDTYQGAVYPLTRTADDAQHDFLGPICAAVSPHGDIYVGGMRDSGWGGGNNIGEIVRLRLEPEKLPAGIAEVRAENQRLVIRLTRPVDRTLAGDKANYVIESYRRESTPAYGGPDQDRRTETILSAELSSDLRRVELDVGRLREGFVYELRLRPLIPDGEFFPAEAYLTVRGS